MLAVLLTILLYDPPGPHAECRRFVPPLMQCVAHHAGNRPMWHLKTCGGTVILQGQAITVGVDGGVGVFVVYDGEEIEAEILVGER